MAPVLHSQWSTSTVDWDDFYTSLSSTGKLKRSRGYTLERWSSGECDNDGAPGTPSTKGTIAMVDLVLNDVYNVICDLYREEIVPSIHEIRRKLRRNHSSLVDAKWLLNICSGDPYNRFHVVNLQDAVQNENEADIQRTWAIMLAGKPFSYSDNAPVDAGDLAHVFQCAVSLASARALDHMEQNDSRFARKDGQNLTRIGGRYLFAEYLRKAGPTHFRKQPLGRLVRLVQAALDAKILVYQDSNIVPAVASSVNARKLLFGQEKNLSTSATCRQLSIQQLKKNIITLLRDKPTQPSGSSPERMRRGPRGGLVLTLNASGESISLCKLPSVYRQKFKEELDYAAGGYHKLADFIRAELPECSVERCDGQKRCQRTPPATPQEAPQTTPRASGTFENFAYIPSTTLLFPLGMSASRFTERAAQCLLANW